MTTSNTPIERAAKAIENEGPTITYRDTYERFGIRAGQYAEVALEAALDHDELTAVLAAVHDQHCTEDCPCPMTASDCAYVIRAHLLGEQLVKA